jgi:coniferyl-aldehyde dehydrogenase
MTDAASDMTSDTNVQKALRAAFDRQREKSRREPAANLRERQARLNQLLLIIREQQEAIADAISGDFGNRSRHESKIAEVFVTVSTIKYTLKHLKEWMKPESRATGLPFAPASSRVLYQPLGVVGIVSPWNYPFQLAMAPLVSAIAAGNRVMLKPSELSPRTSELIQKLLREAFDAELIEVILGGPQVGAAFCALPFDHLLFTGSTRLGRLVMRAASENLTPVTLELGGKSPAIVHESFSPEKAADRIVAGKMFNAGQTCVAPDYVLAPNDMVDRIVEAIGEVIAHRYPTLLDNPDYTSIINDRHLQRLRGLVDDAVERGARALEINPAGETLAGTTRKMAPTVLTGVTEQMAVMQEEIFGPVLPVLGYQTLDDAIAYVRDHPRPLALYYFDNHKGRVDLLLNRTLSGGVSVNDTMMHAAQDDLPFGGVGPSGMGAYHGREGFLTFSHARGVFHQSRINTGTLFSPPYGDTANKLLKLVIG